MGSIACSSGRDHGVIESVDPDGVAFLRLSPDGLVMLDGEPGELAPGQRVRLAAPPELIVIVPFGA